MPRTLSHYDHSSLDTKTEKEKEEAELASKLPKQEESVVEGSPSEPMTAAKEATNDDQYEMISDVEEFDVFYDSDQIQATQVQQKADLFEEIVTQIN